MKKLLSIILALAIVMGALLLIGCNESKRKELDLAGSDSDEPDQSEEQDKKPDKEPDSDEVQGGDVDTPPENNPVPVETLNGKSAKELYESFIAEYTAATSYDILIETNTVVEGIPVNSSVRLKTNNFAVYVKIDNILENTECWFLDPATYLKSGTLKYKIPNAGIDHFLGRDFVETTLSGAMSGAEQETYLKKLNDATIYLHNGEYYFQIELTDEEAAAAGIEAEGFSETVFLNAQGKVKKIVDSCATENVTVTLAAYSDFVNITLPKDAASYEIYYIPEDELEPPFNENAGDQDPRAYAKYQEIFDTLKEAFTFTVATNVDGSTAMQYLFVNKSEFVSVLGEDGNYYCRYYINKKGYEGPLGGTFSQVDVTNDFMSHFEHARSVKQKICDMQLHGNEMKDFTMTKVSSSQNVFTFSHDLGDGAVDYYEISVFYSSKEVDGVSFSIRHTVNGEDIGTDNYDCFGINDRYTEIVVPTA